MKAESLRKARYRERVRAAQALGLAPRSDPPLKAPRIVPGQDVGQVQGQDAPNILPAGQLIQGLQELASDPAASGQARVSAARAVLEVQGHLGRHATGQRDKERDTPPGLLTREALVRELARLRRSILPGTRGQAIENTGQDTP